MKELVLQFLSSHFSSTMQAIISDGLFTVDLWCPNREVAIMCLGPTKFSINAIPPQAGQVRHQVWAFQSQNRPAIPALISTHWDHLSVACVSVGNESSCTGTTRADSHDAAFVCCLQSAGRACAAAYLDLS